MTSRSGRSVPRHDPHDAHPGRALKVTGDQEGGEHDGLLGLWQLANIITFGIWVVLHSATGESRQASRSGLAIATS